jgi:hypothetical protein
VPYPEALVCQIGGASGNVDDFYAEFMPSHKVGLYRCAVGVVSWGLRSREI